MRLGTVIILATLCGAGVFGGVLLLTEPDGTALGLSRSVLPGWYSGDFWLAGLFLLIGFGGGSAAALTALRVRPKLGWALVAVLGATLVVWMVLQITMIGLILPPMQIGFALLGVALIVFGTLTLRRQRLP